MTIEEVAVLLRLVSLLNVFESSPVPLILISSKNCRARDLDALYHCAKRVVPDRGSD